MTLRGMRGAAATLAACGVTVGLLTGCRSPWIQCTIVNHESAPVSLLEVNYPGGSFGVQTISTGASYRYRFHALATDTVSIDFSDAARKSHTSTGPEIGQGQEGTLEIDIEMDGRVSWKTALAKRK